MNAYCGGLDGVSVLQMDSLKATRSLIIDKTAGQGVRFCHIDGSHTAYATANDFDLFSRLLRPGGVIVADDYLVSGWPGVSEGVARYMLMTSSVPIAPVVVGFGKGIFTTKSHHRRYIEAFGALNQIPDSALRTHYDFDTWVF
jgi:predicted O-methyltransferase YrrM